MVETFVLGGIFVAILVGTLYFATRPTAPRKRRRDLGRLSDRAGLDAFNDQLNRERMARRDRG